MQSYEELLKRAREHLPQTEDKGRFEIPEINVQMSGKRTIVRNFNDICKVIRREPKGVAKYLFKELAVPGSIDSGQLFLQSKFSPDMVRKRIDLYVKEFVICHECGKPDTDIIKIGRLPMIRCQACGAKKSIGAR